MALKQNDNDTRNFLRAWRDYRHLTQAEVAARIGTNQNMIAYLERGERRLSVDWLRKLATVLEATPGMLLDQDPATLDIDVIDLWARAPPEKRRQIAEIIRTILKDWSGQD